MELAKALEELDSELQSFSSRPSTLVPDLVLFALATDVLERGRAVLHMADSALPHKAYSNARLAFDGAQQVLVFATHEDYEAAGAQAWVYFASKDAGWRAQQQRKDQRLPDVAEDQWLDEHVAQMSRIWDSVAQGQGALLTEALLRVRQLRKKRPDNWLHEDLLPRQHRAYEILAASAHKRVLAETRAVNEMIYKVLCRETHARPRIESFRINHDPARGTVRFSLSPRNVEQARRAVTGGTELSVGETVAALRWRRTSVAYASEDEQ